MCCVAGDVEASRRRRWAWQQRRSRSS